MIQTYKTKQNVVEDLRKISDQISNEMKDMTFEEERAYLDKLLADKGKSALTTHLAKAGRTEVIVILSVFNFSNTMKQKNINSLPLSSCKR